MELHSLQESARLPRHHILLAFVLVAIVYLPSFFGNFVWDDILLIVNNPGIKSWSGIVDAFRMDLFYGITEVPRITYYRPVITILNVITYKLVGLEAFFFHLENFILHIANATLVFILLKNVLRLSMASSFLGALVFAIHPVNTETVAFISGRTDLLATFFFLAALVLIMYRRSSRKFSFKHLIIPFILYVPGLLSKENVIVFGLMVVLVDYFQSETRSPSSYWKASKKFVITTLSVWVGVTLIYVLVRFFLIKGISMGSRYPGGTFPKTMLTMTKVFFHYIYLLLMPLSQMASYHNYFQVVGSASSSGIFPLVRLILSIFGVFACIGISVFLILKKYKSFLPLWWFLLTLLPVMNIIPFGIWLAERFLYLPSIALSILIGLAGDGVMKKQKAGTTKTACIILVFLLSLYAYMAFQRCIVWRNNKSLWEDVVSKNPENDVALGNLADWHLTRGNAISGLEYVEHALSFENEVLRPLLLRIKTIALINLDKSDEAKETLRLLEKTDFSKHHILNLEGTIHLEQGEYTEAETKFRESLKTLPEQTEARVSLIRLYLKRQGPLDEVKGLAKEIIELDPNHAPAYLYVGIAEERTGNPMKAIDYYKSAIEKNPENYESYFFLANLYDELGDKNPRYYDLALRNFGKVLFLKPDHLDTMLNMGLTYVKLGKKIEAQELWQRVLQKEPDNYEARVNLQRLTNELLNK